MKVGDIIARKDMPMFKFRIVGENKNFPDMWNVEPLVPYRGFGRWKGSVKMVSKDDERWFVVSHVKEELK